MEKITEKASNHRHLEQKSTTELLKGINQEDQSVAHAVAMAIPSIEKVVDAVYDKMLAGGRVFYIGAGTSGRLGIVDASECPPTYGVPQGLVVGLMAGGDGAMRKAVEFAEDDVELGWKDLLQHQINASDFLIGIAASGTTPYVIGALNKAREAGISTACICCNPGSPVAAAAELPIEVITGPEFVTGSTRMKAGTAQKLTLNMISTAVMIKLGRVKDNKMVDMMLTNNKLIERGIKMIMEAKKVDEKTAAMLLEKYKSVRDAIHA